MLWGKANKHMKNDNLFMALNSGIMHNYNVDKTIKHIQILITPKYFVDETTNYDSGSDSDQI